MIGRLAALLAFVLALCAPAGSAWAWVENHVTNHEARIEVDRTGAAIVEHRVTVRLNGNQWQKSYLVEGVDSDAEPLPGAYVVPVQNGLPGPLDSGIPLIPGRRGEGEPGPEGARLELAIDDHKGLYRGSYLFVFRYRTELPARGMLVRDGAMVEIAWVGPRFDDGFDNARVTFVVPSAATPPRAGEALASAEDGAAPLHEVRRNGATDEIELLRLYAPKGERQRWSVRIDRRALSAPIPNEQLGPEARPALPSGAASGSAPLPLSPRALWAIAAVVAAIFALLVALKDREVRRLTSASRGSVPPLLPLPIALRAPLAAAALTGGVALQVVAERPIEGAIAVVASALFAAHGAARLDSSASLRGPGRWLAVTEREGLSALPRFRGAWLDTSTRAGKGLMLLALAPFAAVSAALWPRDPYQGLLVALDAIAVLAVFGTGRMTAMPADMAVEPTRFLRKLATAVRARAGSNAVRLVPRIRIPHGEVDADEVRLALAPRLPLVGFGSIEVAVTYAYGLGARVALPQVLVRVISGSPCDEALAAVSRRARITPGRKAEERVLTFTPRLPTARTTAELALTLALRVVDRAALAASAKRAAGKPKPPPASGRKQRAAA